MTKGVVQGDSGFRSWHFYVMVSMAGATAAVVLSRETHPAALLLLSAAVIAAGLVGVAMHHALAGFAGQHDDAGGGLSMGMVEALEREKALTLRSIKELEFDYGMRKVGEADYRLLDGRLRAKALAIMQDLERASGDAPRHVRPAPAPREAPSPVPAVGAADPAGESFERARVASGLPGPTCDACGTANDLDARFCKGCGAPVDAR